MNQLKLGLSTLATIGILTWSTAQESSIKNWVGYLDYNNISVPFEFTLEYDGDEVIEATLINGPERIKLNQFDKKGDSLIIPLKPFDSFLKVKIESDLMSGQWEKPYRNLFVKFRAEQIDERMKVQSSAYMEVAKKWSVTFKPGTKDAYPGIGLLKQEGNKLTGTVLTEVGDFRYFEGVVDGDSIKLSSFDGAHGFYMAGRKTEAGMSGKFYFDPNYSESWTAVIDEQAELKDPFDIVARQGNNFVPYYDILAAGNGKNVINPKEFDGKVVVIQVFGTWCPNSLDETVFLKDWYENRQKGTDLIAVTYEPNYSKEYGMKRIGEYVEFLKLPYEVYLGGQMSKSHAAIAFPFMDKLAAFPTLLIVDKKGEVRYIHGYFNGPATGNYYEAFKEQFNERINDLLRE